MTRWTKDKIVEAFRSRRKPMVIQWSENDFTDLGRDALSRLEGPEFLVEETAREIIVFKPRIQRKGL